MSEHPTSTGRLLPLPLIWSLLCIAVVAAAAVAGGWIEPQVARAVIIFSVATVLGAAAYRLARRHLRSAPRARRSA